MHPDWTQTPALMLDHTWDRLARRGDHPPRAACLATIAADGRPNARMVGIRTVDRTSSHINVHSDTASTKITELAKYPFATLVIWDTAASLQMRVSVIVAVLTGPDILPQWQTVPDKIQRAFGGNPASSQPLSCPQDWRSDPVPDRFAVLACTVTDLDLLWLGSNQHRRALFTQEDGFAGRWVTP